MPVAGRDMADSDAEETLHALRHVERLRVAVAQLAIPRFRTLRPKVIETKVIETKHFLCLSP